MFSSIHAYHSLVHMVLQAAALVSGRVHYSPWKDSALEHDSQRYLAPMQTLSPGVAAGTRRDVHEVQSRDWPWLFSVHHLSVESVAAVPV